MASNEAQNTNASGDVIVLDDDDIMDLTGQDNPCINYSCKSGEGLMKPPIFCLSYYRIKGKAKGQKVCRSCYDTAATHFEELAVLLCEGKDLLSIDLPGINETVTLDSDTDEEAEAEELIDPVSMEFFREHLEDIIDETKGMFDCNKIMSNTFEELYKRISASNDSYMEVKTMTDSVRKEMDKMLYGLSNALRINTNPSEELIIDDMNTSLSTDAVPVPETRNALTPSDLPRRAALVKPPLVIGNYYYVKRSEVQLMSWIKVRLENIIPGGASINDMLMRNTLYQVYREVNNSPTRRLVDGKSIAYSEPLPMMLEIGTRVIALFRPPNESSRARDMYFQGIVGEFPSTVNFYRYLIFFDDGYALYVHYKHVLPIYESSPEVWEDVHEESRSFIKKYLTEYPNRSMVKLLKNQRIRTEFRGKWYDTFVKEVDCSLVQMFFFHVKRLEWIYRGSRRLKTMYQEEQAASSRLQHKQRNARARNRPITGAPFVQYSSVRDDTDVVFVSQESVEKPEQRAVAKKSTRTMQPQPPVVEAPKATVDSMPPRQQQKEETPPGKIVYYTPRKQCTNKRIFQPHKCGKKCKSFMQTQINRLAGYGPLAKPILCGFYRLQYKARNRRPFIVYKTPCGRTARNMDELHYYLRITGSEMTVDLFNFDPWVRCLAEFILDRNAVLNKDISNGHEPIPLPLVNYVNSNSSDFINYSTERMPMEGVNLNLDPEFLCGCDCDDDCRDKSKCACWKLTLEGAKYLHRSPESIGYVYRRLLEPVITGIYECNSRCKCAKTCLNRVAQNSLQHKLQVFMTSNNRGWGIRCINDIPQGAFICIYAGSLLTDQMANESGQNSSDEYYAELDFIESAELAKQDYEEEAYRSDDEQMPMMPPPSNNSSSKQQSTASNSTVAASAEKMDTSGPHVEEESIRSRLRKRDVEINYGKLDGDNFNVSDEEENGREPSSFNPEADPEGPIRNYPSVRDMFGKDESVFIMDAKHTGNLGRFLNHSCSPNVFVQNVFVDTHDLRFPWVSFFAMQYIRAGTELTWNYNYDVGSVKDKVLYCNCGSVDCKGRLL